MNEQIFDELLKKYIDGLASPEEKILMESWYLEQTKTSSEVVTAMEVEQAGEDMWVKVLIKSGINVRQVKMRRIRYWAAAAAILFCIMAGQYVYHQDISKKKLVQQQIPDIEPGGNKAVLTLSNGRQIVLTGAKNGKMASENNTSIEKTADGSVAYESRPTDTSSHLIYNTLTTPRGGQYHLTLADGTGVWLNASSSIKYPIVFGNSSREVEISGEAYFEVKHNVKKPFRVETNGQVVEVLGTHFNINAYTDEPAIKTTLLEGSVKVSKSGQTAVLKPGQQSVVKSDSKIISVNVADINEAIAWKNGKFSFNDTDIQSVMRQISRWYDVDIQYQGSISTDKLTGTLSRNVSAAKALRLLQFTGVGFEIKGRKIVVK